MQQAARRLHAMGFKTLPIKPGEKVPSCPHGVKDATGDDAATDEWYANRPDDGIGISGEGHVIFDFDVHEGLDGRDALVGWKLPDTLMQTTPSGGMHLIYRCDEDVRPSVNAELAVDVRGWHSYVVCDPTPGYTFEEYVEPAQADAAVMAFLEAVRPPRSRDTAKVGQTRGKARKKVPEGGRNDYLFKYGCSMRAKEIDDDLIRATIHAMNKVDCVPPLPADQVDKTIDSILSHKPGMSDEAKSSERFNHVKVANEMLGKFGACYLDGMPAVFANGRWRTGWDAVERAIIECKRNATEKNRKEVRNYLRLVMPHEKSAPANYIAFSNGVLDVSTMAFTKATADMRIPNVIPHRWEPDAQSDVLDDTLARIACHDPFVENNLCEFIGMCMYRDSKFGYSPVLLGRQGDNASNGKSTYIKLLGNVLGRENYTALDLSTIGERFQATTMIGKLANLGDDISPEFVRGKHLTTFKKVITGEDIQVETKGVQGQLVVRPYCTVVMSANKFPKLGDDSEGVMRRIFPIRFNAKFKPTDPDYDPDISAKLADERAIEAAIVRGVQGLRRVIEQKAPTPNAESLAMVDQIRVDNSSLLQWMEDSELTRADLVGMTTAYAYETYRDWCKNSGLDKAFGKPSFGREMSEKLNLATVGEWRNGKTVRVYRERK